MDDTINDELIPYFERMLRAYNELKRRERFKDWFRHDDRGVWKEERRRAYQGARNLCPPDVNVFRLYLDWRRMTFRPRPHDDDATVLKAVRDVDEKLGRFAGDSRERDAQAARKLDEIADNTGTDYAPYFERIISAQLDYRPWLDVIVANQ